MLVYLRWMHVRNACVRMRTLRFGDGMRAGEGTRTREEGGREGDRERERERVAYTHMHMNTNAHMHARVRAFDSIIIIMQNDMAARILYKYI